MYDPLNVNRIDLTLSQASLRALAGDTLATHTGSVQIGWQPGTAVFTSYKGTLPVMNIATHLKGGYGSRRPIATCTSVDCKVVTNAKPGIKIKFDFGPENATQRFYGLKEITLNSMVQDQSMLHEMVDYRIARSAGIPAPRAGYMRLFVNKQDLGLHMILETYDKQLYKRWFTTGTQHSYEGAYWQDIVLNSSNGVNNYATLQTKVGDELNRDDLQNIARINELTGDAWWEALNQWADVGELTRNWAFEHFIEHWDAYSWFIINNYQVHFDENGIMTMHPWGLDNTLQEGGGDTNVTYLDTQTSSGRSIGIMFTRCLQHLPCKQLYQSSLQKVGSISDAINSVNFVNEIWTAVGPTIQADPIAGGQQTVWAKDATKAFLSGRTKTAEYLTAITGRRESELSLSYSAPKNFVAGTVLSPLLGMVTDKDPVFRQMGDPSTGTCTVDPVSGDITVLAPGDCVVSVSTPAGPINNSANYHAAYSIAYVNLGKIAGEITLPPLYSLAAGTATPYEATSNSSGAITYTTNANCTYLNGKLTAKASTGTCVVTVNVAKDSTHYAATATANLTISRATVRNYSVSTEKAFVAGVKLPKGRTLTLIHKPTKVSGACSVSGTTLKALADRGNCTVVMGSWVTTSQSYVGKTFLVPMSPNPQKWVQKVAEPVSRKKLGAAKFTLANASTIMTTAGQEGFFSFLGNCDVVQTETTTYVQMTGGGVCTVTLEAGPGFKVAALRRVWSFTQ